MKAAQYFGQNDIRIVDVPEPNPKEHEALLAIEWCGICGSDLHEYLHGPIACPPKERPHPTTKEHIPVTLGHEFVGRIVSAPAGSGLKSGLPVVVDPRIYCSSCSQCKDGNTHGCKTLGFKGLSGTGGGFSDTVAVDVKMVHPLPADIDLSLAVLIEPLAVAWHAITTTGLGLSGWKGRSVLVVGGGPVGTAVSIVLRSLGCEKVIVSEPTEVRRRQSEGIADLVINPVAENVAEKCMELTAGEGVDVVFDCAGNQRGFESGMDALRYRGCYMNVALWTGDPMQVPFIPFMLKEITIKCCLTYTDEEFRDVVDAFVAGKFKGLETMVTSKIHIDDIVQKGFNELVANRDQHVKILVTPDRSKV